MENTGGEIWESLMRVKFIREKQIYSSKLRNFLTTVDYIMQNHDRSDALLTKSLTYFARSISGLFDIDFVNSEHLRDSIEMANPGLFTADDAMEAGMYHAYEDAADREAEVVDEYLESNMLSSIHNELDVVNCLIKDSGRLVLHRNTYDSSDDWVVELV